MKVRLIVQNPCAISADLDFCDVCRPAIQGEVDCAQGQLRNPRDAIEWSNGSSPGRKVRSFVQSDAVFPAVAGLERPLFAIRRRKGEPGCAQFCRFLAFLSY
jgi:hypothetical protein